MENIQKNGVTGSPANVAGDTYSALKRASDDNNVFRSNLQVRDSLAVLFRDSDESNPAWG
jgi:hypothetical protein